MTTLNGMKLLKENSKLALETLPFPTRKYGIGILGKEINQLPDQVSIQNVYAFTAPDPVGIYTMDNAPQELLGLLGTLSEQKNKIDAFHYANLHDLVVVRILQGADVKEPIFLTTKLTDSAHIQHILVVAEEGSKAMIVDEQHATPETTFHSHVVEVMVHDHAHLTFVTHQNLNKNTWHLARKYARVGKDAHCNWFEANLGSGYSRVRTRTMLNGVGAQSKFSGIFFGRQEQCLDLVSTTDHLADQTTSLMQVRGALNDKAKALHRGFINIRKGFRNCKGAQKEDTLLLSKEAEIDAVPNLEIENNEVQCTHASSITHLNDEKLFYLESRGIDPQEAKRAMLEGFFLAMLDELPEEVKASVHRQIVERV